MSSDAISDEIWALIGPLFPEAKTTGRPPVDRRTVVEATAWRFRTGAPWRNLPERFGNWNTIYKNFNRWAAQGVWEQVLEKTQSMAQAAGELDWVASIDSTIVRVHQHGAALPRTTGAWMNYKKTGDEPADHAIGRSRGGLTTKSHLVCDGKGRALAFVVTGGQVADTSMLTTTLEQISVAGARGRPRTRPQRLIADKGYPSKANRAWLRRRGIAATIPERADQIAHRRRRPGRPIDFTEDQRQRYRGRNVVERCFNRLKQWRGIAMRSDKYARNYHAGLSLAATLHWLATIL
ncbi:IS5 family transposase [Micrococcus luteus]|uniref:IS5 family transposase n=1 Tax=Micrococcus luteus TaxID=1270 RepID=UPI003F6E0625